MKNIVYILFLIGNLLFSQKEISHTLMADTQLKTIYFTLNKVFNISIHTTAKQEITITAFSEGEYANYFTINEKRTTSTLNVTGDIAFMFPNFQDKLSAHKVHAISVQIWVPENLQVILQSDIGNAKISGNYTSFRADLASGNCFLKQLKGNITASSVSGAIHLVATNGKVTTQTNLGVIKVADIAKGASSYHLKTNKGNITVTTL